MEVDSLPSRESELFNLSGDFPKRNNINLEKIVGIADISIAANIHPIDGYPKLGEIGAFSNDIEI